MFRRFRAYINFLAIYILKPFILIKRFYIYLYKKSRPVINKSINKNRIIDGVINIIGQDRGYFNKFMKFHADGYISHN